MVRLTHLTLPLIPVPHTAAWFPQGYSPRKNTCRNGGKPLWIYESSINIKSDKYLSIYLKHRSEVLSLRWWLGKTWQFWLAESPRGLLGALLLGTVKSHNETTPMPRSRVQGPRWCGPGCMSPFHWKWKYKFSSFCSNRAKAIIKDNAHLQHWKLTAGLL